MLKTIVVGREELVPGHCLPRHRHLQPYAIAVATGFADQAHMTRSVGALTGASPSAWRRDHRTAELCRTRTPPSRKRAGR